MTPREVETEIVMGRLTHNQRLAATEVAREDIVTELTPHHCTVVEVSTGTQAYAWAANGLYAAMRREIAKLTPEAAADQMLAAEIAHACLAARAGIPTQRLLRVTARSERIPSLSVTDDDLDLDVVLP